MPIWRIDDGPVHGLSWGLCQLASQRSQEGANNGFPPSFDLTCANISYRGPDASYNHVLNVAEGAHTLHTGLLTMVSFINCGLRRCAYIFQS